MVPTTAHDRLARAAPWAALAVGLVVSGVLGTADSSFAPVRFAHAQDAGLGQSGDAVPIEDLPPVPPPESSPAPSADETLAPPATEEHLEDDWVSPEFGCEDQTGMDNVGGQDCSCARCRRQRRFQPWKKFQSLNRPMSGESWLNRPFSAGLFVGALWSSDLIADRVRQEAGPIGGLRLGWDIGYRWGLEFRLAYAQPALSYQPSVDSTNSNKFLVADWDVLFYPWGDTRVRPYFLAGFGLGNFSYVDATRDRAINDSMLGIPFGLGLKYRWDQRLVLRGELLDSFLFDGSLTDSTHNFTLTMGLEWRFGGSHRNYWPYQPSRNVW